MSAQDGGVASAVLFFFICIVLGVFTQTVLGRLKIPYTAMLVVRAQGLAAAKGC